MKIKPEYVITGAGLLLFLLGSTNFVPQVAQYSQQMKLLGAAATVGGIGLYVWNVKKGQSSISRYRY